MTYTSWIFPIFLLAVSVIYFRFPSGKYQWTVLLAASYIFYLWAGWQMAGFLILATGSIYLSAIRIERIAAETKAILVAHKKEWTSGQKRQCKEQGKKRKKRILTAALVLNFGILAFLKYYNFFTEGVSGLLSLAGIHGPGLQLRLLLPLGISFYTFQSTGYLIDVYRGKYPAEKNPFRFALFVSFFPQIVQGPISFYDQLAGQLFEEHRANEENIRNGVFLMVWGYFKKMVIADHTVTLITTVSADYTAHSGTVIFLTVLVYAVQLYADFSGGIDISRGFAEVLGIRMAENFRRPYFAISINDYWRRWHITLGAWMKTYIFYSLATSRRFLDMGKHMRERMSGTAAGAHIAKVFPTALSSLITFLVVGIWHGSNLKYLAFGVWNGGVIMLSILLQPLFDRIMQLLHIPAKSVGWRILQTLRTFLIVLVGYVFDIAPNLAGALDMLRRCITDLSFNLDEISQALSESGLGFPNLILLIVCTLFLFAVSLIQERDPATTIRQRIWQKPPVRRWAVLMAALLAIAIFGCYGPGYQVSEFVYMQF